MFRLQNIAGFTLLCVLLCALPCPSAFAGEYDAPRLRPDSPKAWSELVYSYYQSISSMHASFEQIITHKESGIEEQRTGELFFRKPFLARWVSDEPYPELLLADREFLWQYLPEEKLAFKYKVADIDGQSAFLTVITGQAPLAEKFKITPADENEGVQALRLLPYTPSTNLVEASIWVDTDTGIILRLIFTDFYGNLNDIAFTNQEPNIHIAPEVFIFQPPPGVTVEDHSRP